ncbi:S-antigen, N-terminal domain-containing protein [Fimicolochytrium jonesii]|uniref:S-antigen, N-terminal domain-containing protein n=1 Tax=Fimicolochytrium jonesii TaxID=1396493 RepID=UPI0022FDDE4E|nr:S-antigen, N-terminal domain-containing protein [Fimicolochytrium jonesii]KAI8821826.1 S-antigen, N-terminal domain-containing protein [Fimicolochytrium jonesii]
MTDPISPTNLLDASTQLPTLVPPPIHPFQTKKQISRFDIELEGGKTTFSPGQILRGEIVLVALTPVKVKLLRVRFSGIIQTQLHKTDDIRPADQNTSTVTLFKELESLIGSIVPSNDTEDIPEGEHRYPFAFRVPPAQLPPSFEGRYGRVRYEVAAVLARPGQLNKLVYHPVTVPSTLDASDLDMLEGSAQEQNVPVGFWLWKSGHLAVRVSTPRTGYTSEETVPLSIDITNHSGSGVVLKAVALKQRASYKIVNELRGPFTERIHRLNFTETFSSKTRRINRIINFPIPSSCIMPPSIKSVILNVTHVLVVKITSTASFSKSLKIQLPIVITGFPAVYFDPQPTFSVDTLPMYLNPAVVHSREVLGVAPDPPGVLYGGDGEGGEETDAEVDDVEVVDVDVDVDVDVEQEEGSVSSSVMLEIPTIPPPPLPPSMPLDAAAPMQIAR